MNPALGNIKTLTIGNDLDGTLIVSGTLGTFNLGGSLDYDAAAIDRWAPTSTA